LIGGDAVVDFVGQGMALASNVLGVTDDVFQHTLDSAEIMTIIGDSTIQSDDLDLTMSPSWTGAHDFGSATSLELPNVNNPTTNVEGEIAWDANNDMLEVYDGAASVIVAGKIKFFTKGVDQPDLVANDTIIVLPVEAEWAPFGITLVSVGIKTRAASTYSVEYQEFTQPDNGGTESSIEIVATSSSTEAEDDGTLTDAAIAAGSIVMAILPATDVDYLELWGTFTINPGN
jgi:hypothetical protein